MDLVDLVDYIDCPKSENTFSCSQMRAKSCKSCKLIPPAAGMKSNNQPDLQDLCPKGKGLYSPARKCEQDLVNLVN